MTGAAVRTLTVPTTSDVQRELSRLIDIPPEETVRMAGRFFGRILLIRHIVPAEAQALAECCSRQGISTVSKGGSVIIAGADDALQTLCLRLPPHLAELASRMRAELSRSGPRVTWQTSRRTLSFDRRPLVMGILNVTPDSFSDGNAFFDQEKAVERALELEAQGADIIDIGGESTKPFADPVAAEEELRRVIPVVERLVGRLRVPISVDTYKAAVARRAMEAGAEIINDVSGLLFDPEMCDVVAETGAGAVLMHTRGRPDEMQRDTVYGDLMSEVVDALIDRIDCAVSGGISPDRLVVDPGLGFAKDRDGNLEILRRLRELESLGFPVLVGSSRKKFTSHLFGRDLETRLFSTAATVALAVANGAAIVRVHDVREMRDVADMSAAIVRT